jgi:hypothetical protein
MNIPEKYRILIESDWNQGNDSNMTSIQRGELNQLWLEYLHYQIKQEINQTFDQTEEPVVGFPD